MTRIGVCTLALLFISAWVECLFGRTITYDGTEEGFWDNRSIVYAEVIGTEIKGRSCRCIVRIKATLTGAFDALRHDAELTSAEFRFGVNSAIASPPELNKHFLMLVDNKVDDVPAGDDSIGIREDFFKVFPSLSAIEEVTNFDDPKVGSIIEAIRKIRNR